MEIDIRTLALRELQQKSAALQYHIAQMGDNPTVEQVAAIPVLQEELSQIQAEIKNRLMAGQMDVAAEIPQDVLQNKNPGSASSASPVGKIMAWPLWLKILAGVLIYKLIKR